MANFNNPPLRKPPHRNRFIRFVQNIFYASKWKFLIAFLLLLTAAFFILWLIGTLNQWNWAPWTGLGSYIDSKGGYQTGLTLWEFIKVLIIPIILAITAKIFSDNQKKTELEIASLERVKDREIARDRYEEDFLRQYFEQMEKLIFDRQFQTQTEKKDEVRAIALARTRMALRFVNGERKGLIIVFLSSSHLIGGRFEETIISLEGIDLQGIILDDAWMAETDVSETNMSSSRIDRVVFRGAKLFKCDLQGSSLRRCNFQNAQMVKCDMTHADLTGSFMQEADLSLSDLSYADLTDVKFDNATLLGANFTGAKVTKEQIKMAKDIRSVIFPDGTKELG